MNLTIAYLRRATDFLRERGVANARLDAEVLLADVLGVDRVGVYLNHDRPLSAEEIGRYREGVRRRAKREPLQHIRGRQEFYSREFLVDGRALVPRSETELLVDVVLEEARNRYGLRVLDVGTGSGAIAATLALERGDAWVAAVDVSTEALAVATTNLRRLAASVVLVAGDLLGCFRGRSFDVLVSNPPYVTAGQLGSLEPEVRDYDPPVALDGGPDGLGTVRCLIEAAPFTLKPRGFLAVEVGAGQAPTVADLVGQAGFEDVRVRRDLSGVERVVSGRIAS